MEDEFGPSVKEKFNAAGKRLEKLKPYVDEFTKTLEKAGFQYHVFITPSKMAEGKDVAASPAICEMNLAPLQAVTHVISLFSNSGYVKCGLLALLMVKKGKVKFKHTQMGERGVFDKLKDMFR